MGLGGVCAGTWDKRVPKRPARIRCRPVLQTGAPVMFILCCYVHLVLLCSSFVVIFILCCYMLMSCSCYGHLVCSRYVRVVVMVCCFMLFYVVCFFFLLFLQWRGVIRASDPASHDKKMPLRPQGNGRLLLSVCCVIKHCRRSFLTRDTESLVRVAQSWRRKLGTPPSCTVR